MKNCLIVGCFFGCILNGWTAGDNGSFLVKSFFPTNIAVGTNVIRLSLDFANQRGIYPEAIAIAVNPTNAGPFFGPTEMPGANWLPFQAEQVITLEPNVKRHTIAIGSKRTGFPRPVWQEIGVRITNLPPVLVLTNPLERATSVKLLQIQGFADVALRTIRCLRERTDGGQESIQGFVTRQEMQVRSPMGAVTNYFQCFDIDLNPGTNQFSLRCTDIYGNVAVTNFPIIFETKSDKTPPSISAITPPPGGQVFSSGFTICGRLDDPSAKITGTVVAEGRKVKIDSGVGRNGMFLFAGIPIIGATNQITLKATDPAGNVTTTNFVLYRSHVGMSLDPISDAQWSHSGMTVTGKINVQDHALWVNGTRAKVNPDGTWVAEKVRVPTEESASFTIKALPLNTDTNAPGIQISL